MVIHLFYLLVKVGFFDNPSSAWSSTSLLYLYKSYAV